jgi:hypothetical protein
MLLTSLIFSNLVRNLYHKAATVTKTDTENSKNDNAGSDGRIGSKAADCRRARRKPKRMVL